MVQVNQNLIQIVPWTNLHFYLQMTVDEGLSAKWSVVPVMKAKNEIKNLNGKTIDLR